MIFNSALSTPRLRIRPFRQEDAPELVALFADPLVARHVDDGEPLDPHVAELWIEKSLENLANYGFGTGAVTLVEDLTMIGWAGIARPPDGSEEIIYGLARTYWNYGYGSELVDALSQFALSKNLNPVRATVHAENQRSRRLLLRAGFVLADSAHGGDPLTELYLKSAQ